MDTFIEMEPRGRENHCVGIPLLPDPILVGTLFDQGYVTN